MKGTRNNRDAFLGCGVLIYFVLCFIFPVLWWGWILIIFFAAIQKENKPIPILQIENIRELFKQVVDTPNMTFPLNKETVEPIYHKLHLEDRKYSERNLRKDLKFGFVQFVIEEYVRVQLGNSIWFKQYIIKEHGLNGLHVFFKTKGIKVLKDSLKQEINAEFLRQTRERFKESFLDYKPELRSVKKVKPVIEGYIDVFGEAYRGQLNNLNWYIKEFLKKRISNKKLEKLIQVEIQHRANLLMAKSIRSSIQERMATQNQMTIEEIDTMNGIEFEHFLQKLFSAMGYRAEVTKASGDQGADLLAEKYGTKIAIQAKCYSGAVGNKAVQEVIGAMQYYNCQKGMVVTNSTFTKSALDLALKSDVEMIDRDGLKKLLKKYGMAII